MAGASAPEFDFPDETNSSEGKIGSPSSMIKLDNRLKKITFRLGKLGFGIGPHLFHTDRAGTVSVR
jgi:hypothetical protein